MTFRSMEGTGECSSLGGARLCQFQVWVALSDADN
jgi:hypothetical protein